MGLAAVGPQPSADGSASGRCESPKARHTTNWSRQGGVWAGAGRAMITAALKPRRGLKGSVLAGQATTSEALSLCLFPRWVGTAACDERLIGWL